MITLVSHSVGTVTTHAQTKAREGGTVLCREQPHRVNSDEVEEGEVQVGKDTAEEGMVEESEVVLNEQKERFEGMQLAEDDAIVSDDIVTQFISDPNYKTLVDTYKSELGRDETLAQWHWKADRLLDGFRWSDGILVRNVEDGLTGTRTVCVLTGLRTKFLSMVNKCTSHLTHSKMIQLLKRSCTWPSMLKDAKSHCKACRKCQEYKTGASRAPMAEVPIMTEPFNNLVFDIVGPFDRSGAGFKYHLTYTCLAPRFPEAILLEDHDSHGGSRWNTESLQQAWRTIHTAFSSRYSICLCSS